MSNSSPSQLQQRVVQAAEAALKRQGSVGPLEMFQALQWLQPAHFEGWRKGNDYYRVIEPFIQVGPEKLHRAIEHFQEWAAQRELRTLEAAYTRRGPGGIESLQITPDGNPEREKFYRTHYARADLDERKTARLAAKIQRPPELVVFQKVGEAGNCSTCGAELPTGECLVMEKGQPLCLACADMDDLLFLAAGDATLSRRARLHSSLAAVVVRFNRSRNRYERQGLLVTEEGLAQAEAQCAADAPERAEARVGAATRRQAADDQFVAALAQAIVQRYPGCPADEARHIAEHTGRRSSGRVGRSAAGRALEPAALDLAVRAHIRHAHTRYDELLMRGTERSAARARVADKINALLARWSLVADPHARDTCTRPIIRSTGHPESLGPT